MIDITDLLSIDVDAPVFFTDCDAARAGDLEMELARSGLIVRHLRGRKMQTMQALFDEFAAAFQFPLYFGENSAALDDCLSDLEWMPNGAGFVLTLFEPEQVLARDADRDDGLAWLGRRLSTAQRRWAEPPSGETAVPFHSIVHAGVHLSDQLRYWESLGIQVSAEWRY
jgi:hypothetical protein